MSASYSGALSDDIEIIALGKAWGLYIYKYDSDNQNYTYSQSLNMNDSIWHVEISKNHTIMVVSTYGLNVYLYRYDG